MQYPSSGNCKRSSASAAECTRCGQRRTNRSLNAQPHYEGEDSAFALAHVNTTVSAAKQDFIKSNNRHPNSHCASRVRTILKQRGKKTTSKHISQLNARFTNQKHALEIPASLQRTPKQRSARQTRAYRRFSIHFATLKRQALLKQTKISKSAAHHSPAHTPTDLQPARPLSYAAPNVLLSRSARASTGRFTRATQSSPELQLHTRETPRH